MKFDKVQIEHINLALEDYQTKGIPEGFGASNYFDIEIEGALYPPKVIMAYANFHATGEKPTNNFSGGRKTPCFKAYERLEIKIIPKANPKEISAFIELYKKLISNQLPDITYSELYKWETFQHFKDNWKDDYDESNILQNLTSSFNYENNNLWSGSHYLPFKSIKDYATKYPQKVSEMFHELYDESKDLHVRMLHFETAAKEILKKLYPTENWDHYQSPRAMLLYLSLRYPDKYYLYKNGMFNDFCKISNYWPPFGAAKSLDYTVIDEFLTMCNELKKELLKDDELIEMHKKRLPSSITFEDGNNLLVQDFIYSVSTYLNPNNKKQGEPITFILANITWNSKDWKEVSEDASGHAWVGGDNIPHESWNFDFDNERNEEGKVLGFAKFTHPPKVEGSNNLIIFYSKGQIVGFYGKAEVLKEVVDINEKESYNLIGDQEYSIVLDKKIDGVKEKGYLEGKERVGQVGFGYIQNSSIVLDILNEAVSLNPSQEEQIQKIIEWVETAPATTGDESRLIELLAEIGYEDSVGLYSIMERLIASLNIEIGDPRIHYTLPKNKLIGLTIGQKYASIIEIIRRANTYRYFDTSKGDKNWLKSANSIQEMSNQFETILNSAKAELAKTDKTSYAKYSSDTLEKSLFDPKYKQYIFAKAFNKNIKAQDMSSELNQIFFGPPGTGKTYHTINEAIKIVDPVFYEKHKEDRTKLKERFKLLLLKEDNEDIGQIGFTTFHQSFSYEDFIEGIKPLEPVEGDTYLKYEIQEGIFKRICRIAGDSLRANRIESENKINLSEDDFNKAQFYKISLGNTQLEEDKEIFDYCIEHECITIGFGEGKNLSGMNERELRDWGSNSNISDDATRSLNYFKNFLKEGNYILVSNGNHYLRAIGRVLGEYEFKESPFADKSTFNHFRKVEWLYIGEDVPAKDVYFKNFTQKTIYKLEKSEVKKEFFVKGAKSDNLNLPKNPKNYVLIVDEINRGNVSSIFGELITLIEKDKRAGTDEELSVLLPYSKKQFKVPHNVYIIGTMNTADRSIEALDTALRRRFSFKEMPPKSDLLAPNRMFWELLWKYKDLDWEHKDYKPKEEGLLSLFGASDKFMKDRVAKWEAFKKEGQKETQVFELPESEFKGVNLSVMLETINNRIEKLLDKDHKIGHSYFLNVCSDTDLRNTFKDKVIPLLEEYFFGDFGKISLVLGSSFITKTTKSNVTFAKDNEYDPSIASDLQERSVYVVTPMDQWNFKAIYE